MAVGVIKRTNISPPCIHCRCTDLAVLRILENEEDKYGRDGNAGIKTGREYVIVFCPPAEVTPPDNILEDESNNAPWDVVDSGRGGDQTGTSEDNGEAKGIRMSKWLGEIKDVETHLIYLKKELGNLRVITQGMTGATAPIKKKNTRG